MSEDISNLREDHAKNSNSSPTTNTYAIAASSDNSNAEEDILPQGAEGKPCGCGSEGGSIEGQPPSSNPYNKTMNPVTYSFVYALGRIQPRFPSPSLEKEYFQVVGQTDTTG